MFWWYKMKRINLPLLLLLKLDQWYLNWRFQFIGNDNWFSTSWCECQSQYNHSLACQMSSSTSAAKLLAQLFFYCLWLLLLLLGSWMKRGEAIYLNFACFKTLELTFWLWKSIKKRHVLKKILMLFSKFWNDCVYLLILF